MTIGAKEIMQDAHIKVINYLEDIKDILKNEGAVIRIGYKEEDVNIGVPRLMTICLILCFFVFLAK